MSLFILGLGSALSAWFSERPKAQLTPELLDKILNLAMTEGGFTAALRMLNALGGAEQFEGFFGGLSLWAYPGGPLEDVHWLLPGRDSLLPLMEGDPLLSLLWMANARRLNTQDQDLFSLRDTIFRILSSFTQENFGVFEKGIPSEMRLRRAVMRLEFVTKCAGHHPGHSDYDKILDLAASPQDGSEPWVSTHDLEEFLESDWLRDSGWVVLKHHALLL